MIVALGALLQGTIGFGLGLFAAPLLLLVDPRLVPGSLLAVSAVLTLLIARRDWHGVRTADLGWSLSGRIVGTLAALAVLRLLTADWIEVVFGGLILVAVGLTAAGIRLVPGPRVLVGAGLASGFMGTLTTVGGPAIALVYQHEPGPSIRGTLSAFFVVGVVLSVAGLAAIGRFGLLELKLAGMMVPAVVAGYWLSAHTAPVMDRGFIRPAVLVVSGASAAIVILRQIL